MSDGFSIKIKGFEELEQKLKALEPKLSKKILRSALKQVGNDLLAEVIEKAPSKSGALIASLSSKVSIGKNKVAVKVGSDSGDFQGQFYAAFYELGTRHQPARPFLRPALQQNDANIIQDVADKIKEGLENI